MFYLLELEKELEIPPRLLGPRFREEVTKRLRHEVEGSCSGHYGYLLAVHEIIDIGRGLIREGIGSAVFKVKYQCISFMPFKGEALDATVRSVNKMGFFAEAGPLQIFVSNHMIPDTFEFDSAHEPCYISSAGDTKIEAGTEVRLKIIGTRIDANEIFAVGTVKDDYLGALND